MTELNGDVEMKNADDQCDTVAILDAGAQYGKVLFHGLRFMTRHYVRTDTNLSYNVKAIQSLKEMFYSIFDAL